MEISVEKILLVISALCISVCIAFGVVYGFDALGKIEYTEDPTEAQSSLTKTADSITESLSSAIEITVETETFFPETEVFAEITTEAESSSFENETESVNESDIVTVFVTETEEVTEKITDIPTEEVSEEITETEPFITTEIVTDTEQVPTTDERSEIKVPILMYHALTENDEEASSTVITVDAFREQIAAISEMGYTSVFFRDIRDYVINGTPLPEKPILITFDDGYLSNLELAGAILAEYGHRATVSVIGVSVGKDTYKDTGTPIYPHFSLDEAREAYGSRIFDFQSHTFDMHQNEYDNDPRHGMLQKENESDEEYRAALAEDFTRSKELLENAIGNDVFVIIYPHGRCTEEADNILRESGADVSVTVEEGINLLRLGEEETLRFLRRLNMDDGVSGEMLLTMLEGYMK